MLLLSFAQFEREVTAERIRDKIAASKKKGLWMGGNVPLGYEAVDRTLRIVPKEAETVQTLFDLYEQLGTVTAVTREATRLGLRSKSRTGRDGTPKGGSIMSRGQIHHVLSNPVYAGRIRHKDQVHDGQHEAIIDLERWEHDPGPADGQVRQASVVNLQQLIRHRWPASCLRMTGDRLTPSHATKGGTRYRYYVSRRLVGGKHRRRCTTSGWRLPADRLERDLGYALRLHLLACIDNGTIAEGGAGSIPKLRGDVESLGNASLDCIDTARLGAGTLSIELKATWIVEALGVASGGISPEVLSLRLPFSRRRRGVETRMVIGTPQPAHDDILIANIARGERWRVALCNGNSLTTIAARDGITEKYLGQMLCFAFLSPKLVRAILDGRQPPELTTNWLRRHGLPMFWAEQDRIIAQL